MQAQLAHEGSAAVVNWLDLMRDVFHGIAAKLGDDGAITQLYRWTQGDYAFDAGKGKILVEER